MRIHTLTPLPVVILAGGLGTRLGQESDRTPKPLVRIGPHPILAHIISMYVNQGHNEFIICAGFKADQIKEYFSNFTNNYSSPRITFHQNTQDVKYLSDDEDILGLGSGNWNVTVVDTGLDTTTAGRLSKVAKLIDSDTFLCTYGDGVSDLDINEVIAFHHKSKTLGTLTAFHPPSRFGEIDVASDGKVIRFQEKPLTATYVNGGFFVFNAQVLQEIDSQLTLEEGLLSQLTMKSELSAFLSNSYWQMMDTPREVEILNHMYSEGKAPWISARQNTQF